MFNKFKRDYTDVIARASNAKTVKDKSKYPKKPKVNDPIFDSSLGAVKLWDGKKWITICTGLKAS